MIISKFGGTSVSTAERINTICTIARRRLLRKPVIVVSALSKVTDLLLTMAREPRRRTSCIKDIRARHLALVQSIWRDEAEVSRIMRVIDTRLREAQLAANGRMNAAAIDKLSSFGEIMSSYIVSEALKKNGIPSQQVIATEIIVTNDEFGKAEFTPAATRVKVRARLLPLVKKGVVPVVTGFIGATRAGRTTTLGRGGSDYSAAILGYSLDADEIEIWTDVDGILTADPRMVKSATLIPKISYREASELANFGAKVLHPRTIRPAMKANIPVRVLNTLNPRSKGTLILEDFVSRRPATAISSKKAVILINMYSTEMLFSKGFLARTFEVFSRHNISVDLVSVSEVSISVTLDNGDDLGPVLREIKKFAAIEVSEDFGMVSLIGSNIATSSKNIRRIFDMLDAEGILVRMVSLGSVSINVSLVLWRRDVERAVRVLHDTLVMGKN